MASSEDSQIQRLEEIRALLKKWDASTKTTGDYGNQGEQRRFLRALFESKVVDREASDFSGEQVDVEVEAMESMSISIVSSDGDDEVEHRAEAIRQAVRDANGLALLDILKSTRNMKSTMATLRDSPFGMEDIENVCSIVRREPSTWASVHVAMAELVSIIIVDTLKKNVSFWASTSIQCNLVQISSASPEATLQFVIPNIVCPLMKDFNAANAQVLQLIFEGMPESSRLKAKVALAFFGTDGRIFSEVDLKMVDLICHCEEAMKDQCCIALFIQSWRKSFRASESFGDNVKVTKSLLKFLKTLTNNDDVTLSAEMKHDLQFVTSKVNNFLRKTVATEFEKLS